MNLTHIMIKFDVLARVWNEIISKKDTNDEKMAKYDFVKSVNKAWSTLSKLDDKIHANNRGTKT